MSIRIAGELVEMASKEERERCLTFFRKIQEAAYDGQNGSANYAMDRLALIQAIATAAIEKFSD